jgi:hypothetical protein
LVDTCKGICKKYEKKDWVFGTPRYATPQDCRCTECGGIYMVYYGIRCPCCGRVLRRGKRSKKKNNKKNNKNKREKPLIAIMSKT